MPTVDFTSLVFFGDSLTDNGNLFNLIGQPAPPYVNGRFSNGPTYAEIAPGLLGVGALNFAFGGAEAVTGNGNPDEFALINLQAQVDAYLGALGGNPPPPGTAAALFIGNNDYLRAATTPQTPQQLVADVLLNVGTAALQLIQAGVGKIILFTLPGIDLSPLGAFLGPAAVASYDAIVQANNAGLAQVAAQLGTFGADVEVVDTYRFFTEMKNDTATFGFEVTAIPVIDNLGNPTGISALFDPDEIAFFDAVHPTGALHGVTAAYVAAILGADQVLVSDAGNGTVTGGTGDDFIMTGTGNDFARGRAGGDQIFAGTGNDFADGGAGDDIVSGGAGSDFILGGTGSDVVAGNAGNDYMDGGNGADALVLGTGSDIAHGGNGADLFLVEDEAGVGDCDWIFGGGGTDTLRLLVSQATFASAAFQADLAAFAGSYRHGVFRDHDLATIGLRQVGIERIEVIVDIPGAIGEAVAFSAGAAAPAPNADLAAVLARADLWGLV